MAPRKLIMFRRLNDVKALSFPTIRKQKKRNGQDPEKKYAVRDDKESTEDVSQNQRTETITTVLPE